MSSILFDDDDLQVIFLEGRQSQILAVTFSSLGMFKAGGGSIADGKVFWGRQFIEKTCLNAVEFVAKRPHWFVTPSMRAATAAAMEIVRRHKLVVAYGSSMGGFAALKFSKTLSSTVAISCGPQATLNNSALPSPDPRYQHYFRSDCHAMMGIGSGDVCAEAYLIYDPFCELDKMHAFAIRQQAPQVTLLPAYFAGHECVRIFGSTQAAINLVLLGAAHDKRGLKILIDSLRRRSPVRALEIALRAIERRPSLSNAILAKYEANFDRTQRALLLSALELRSDWPAPGLVDTRLS